MRCATVTLTLMLVTLPMLLFSTAVWAEAPLRANNSTGKLSFSSSQQAAPTPTPMSRPVGRRPGARTTTTGLVSKGRTTPGGGGDSLGVCNSQSYIFPEDTEIFGIFPETRVIELHKPHILNDLIVEACNWRNSANAEYTFTLIDPDGVAVTQEMGPYLIFDFRPNAKPGDYQLIIARASAVYPVSLTVLPYSGPRLELTDPVSGENRALSVGESSEVNRSSGVLAHFYGFTPNSELEIGLFQWVGEGPVELRLIDSWLASADRNGEYAETLSFSAATDAGNYMLSACALDACDLEFSILDVEPYGPPNAILTPPIAWEMFSLGGAGTALTAQPRVFNFMRCSGPCSQNSTPVTQAAPERSTRLNFQWEYSGFPVGANYVRSWRVAGKGEWIRYECIWQGPASGIQQVALTEPEGLYSGAWELTVAVDGAVVLRETVYVDGDWTYWDPAGFKSSCQ